VSSGPAREITFDDIKLEMEKGSPFTRDGGRKKPGHFLKIFIFSSKGT
jgi:hypothetical protein